MRDRKVIVQAKIRDQHKCQRCGEADHLHVHHIHALSDGGSDTIDNVVTLCDTCHYGWHHRFEGWISFPTFMSEPLKGREYSHSKRLRAAKSIRRKKGVFTGGHVPYGFKIENRLNEEGERERILVPHPEQYPNIERIQTLRREGQSFRTIYETLLADGVTGLTINIVKHHGRAIGTDDLPERTRMKVLSATQRERERRARSNPA